MIATYRLANYRMVAKFVAIDTPMIVAQVGSTEASADDFGRLPRSYA